MENLQKFLIKNKNKTLMAVFPHMDDESFVSAGLFQIAQKIGVKTHLIVCGTGIAGDKDSGEKLEEFNIACKLLGVDKKIVLDLGNEPINKNINEIVNNIIKE